MKSLILGILLISLAACSSEKDQPTPALDMVNIALGKIRGLGGNRPKTPTAAEIRASATPEALAKIGRPVMLAELPDIGLADILIFVQQNGSHTTWASSDGVSFIFQNGLLTGTRGMGRDLMTADVEEPAQAIPQGNGEAVRVHRYLDGDDQIIFSAFFCRYNRLQNGVVSEFCKSRHYEFENQYWLGSDGRIARSRQWIGPERGYLVTERLI